MKRIIAILLLVMLLAVAVPATSLAAGAVSNGDTKVYHVTASALHLRAKPNDRSAIYATLPYGTALLYKGRSGSWYKVRTTNGLTGYVFRKYTGNYGKANVNTRQSGLNVRKTPNGRVMYSIPHGTKGVIVYALNGNWGKVNYRGKGYGYASLAYLKWTRW